MYYGYSPYVSVASKKEKARKEIEKMRKNKQEVEPVEIVGNRIAKNFWGISWNRNFENYSDFHNRLARGSSYVKSGMIIDLKISEELVTALVMGSERKPYSIKVNIKKIEGKKLQEISDRCHKSISSLQMLAEGSFPKEFTQLFLNQDKGIFPSPKEISFTCSCLDSAIMCKHVAAVLYGIGARFDKDPLMFFKLRGIKVEDLIKKSASDKMKGLLENANKKQDRVIDDATVNDLFSGILN